MVQCECPFCWPICKYPSKPGIEITDDGGKRILICWRCKKAHYTRNKTQAS